MGTGRIEGRFGAKIGESLDIGTSFCLSDHWQKQQRSHIISRYRVPVGNHLDLLSKGYQSQIWLQR